MRKTMLVEASLSIAMLVAGGVAWAATIRCPNWLPNAKTCYGTEKADTMYGTQQDDFMFGRGGPDKLYFFRNGGDGVYEGGQGGPGSDKLFGGKGKDNLWGGGWSNAGVLNDRADDYLHGGRAQGGVDRLFGEDGDDWIYAAYGDGRITKEIIDCGPGTSDEVDFDEGVDVVKNCEIKRPH
jgi:Ca2+-binding RTX toxin-like protein